MQLRYFDFSRLKSQEDLKKEYRELAKIHHPDNLETGNVASMQVVQDEFNYLRLNLEKEFQRNIQHQMFVQQLHKVREVLKQNNESLETIEQFMRDPEVKKIAGQFISRVKSFFR